MEEMMMKKCCVENTQIQSITTSTFSSWKLYENPFYNSQQVQKNQQNNHNHHLHFPLSARNIAASLWNLAFFKPIMHSDLDIARAHIVELKAELESERKVRKKLESVNKRLVKELSEERKGREAMERVCEELAEEIASDRVEINRMRKEMEKERKMLRTAEILREERVQMKLNEAKILFEEKLSELELSKVKAVSTTALPEKLTCNDHNDVFHLKKGSPEAENPHIKRAIKGFVEFPKVVRTIGSRGRNLGTKLECQKAQLRLLLRQKSPYRINNLIIG